MTPKLTDVDLADLRAAMRSAKACEDHVRYRDPQGAEGTAAVFAPDCNACCDAVSLAVAERVRERYMRYARVYNKTHRPYRSTDDDAERCRARILLREAVRWRKVHKPASCSACGVRVNARALHGHHHRGYARPLDVEWLCTLCHGAQHRKGATK